MERPKGSFARLGNSRQVSEIPKGRRYPSTRSEQEEAASAETSRWNARSITGKLVSSAVAKVVAAANGFKT